MRSPTCWRTVTFTAPSAPVVSNHDGAAYDDDTDGWRTRLAEHVTVPVRWRTSMETLAGLRRRRVRRGRPRLDDRRGRQAHGSRPVLPCGSPDRMCCSHGRAGRRATADVFGQPQRDVVVTVPVTRPSKASGSRGRAHDRRAGRRRLPGRSASTRARPSRVGEIVGVVEGPGHPRARCAARSRRTDGHAGPLGRTPARRPARRLVAGRVTCFRPAIVGWGTAVPDGKRHERRPRGPRRHDRRVDRRTHGHPRASRRAPSARRPRRSRTAAAAQAIKRAGLAPADIDLLIIATASPEQPIPHTGAFVGEALGLAVRLVRPERGVRRVRVRARRRRVDAPDGVRPRACSSARRR